MLSRRRFLAASAATGALVACGDDETTFPVDDPDGPGPMSTKRFDYGDDEDQVADLWLPADAVDPVPVVVLIHGGFWLQQFDLSLMDGLADSLASNGIAAWNIEYRRVGGAGGYPQTFDDVAAAIDHLAVLDDGRLDLGRVAVVGHSAGGHLAVWGASRQALPPEAPWAEPTVRPVVAVSLAGVLDLVTCAEQRLGGSACIDLLRGTPAQEPEHYAWTSPIELAPIAVPVVALHGDADGNVPLSQSADYVDRAAATGDPAELVVIEGADHFDVIDPTHESWAAVLDRRRDSL